MELKVWVEGIQRVVCGITEQTTVQEVVIALAQATGRTGRYTLVEKWRDMEKLLPPSEYPIKVLEKWGEYAGEVQFLLKRTGASSASSDTENIRAPERNTYRQSLPPPAKHREKSELLQALKRKEPKRKSLTITGSASSNLEDSREKSSQNSNSNNNKTMPDAEYPTHMKQSSRDRTYSGSSSANVKKAAEKFKQLNGEVSNSKSKEKSKSKNKTDKKTKEDSKSGKKALMPLKTEPGKTTVSSATRALFPSESKSEVVAKSPVRKHPDNSIKNLNSKKVPLMPPTNKALRNRNSTSFDQSSPQSSQDNPSPSHTRNLSSGSLTPSPFSLPPSENKVVNYAYRYGNSLPRSKKKSWSETQSSTQDDTKAKPTEGNKKPALMPPIRKRAVTPNPTTSRESFHPALRDSYPQARSQPVPRKNSEDLKAEDNFVHLITEQQRHIEDQMKTVSALDQEIQIVLEKMSQKEKSADDEIKKLEERNKQLRAQLENEDSLRVELSKMEDKVVQTKTNMSRLQAEMDQSDDNLASYKRKIDDLTKAIADETYLQSVKQRKKEEDKRNQAIRSRKDVDRMNRELSSVENEIRRIERESALIDKDINEKYNELDTLNRELRQVNLQQFIRQTGSKVTVLPPNTEDQQENSVHKMYQSNPALNISGSRNPLPPPPSGNSEGVWV